MRMDIRVEQNNVTNGGNLDSKKFRAEIRLHYALQEMLSRGS